MSEEWLEIRARSREDAIAAAVDELGLSDPEQVHLDVVEEPERGLFGFGGKDGLFRASKKRSSSRRRRRRRGSGSSASDSTPSKEATSDAGAKDGGKPAASGKERASRGRSSGRKPRGGSDATRGSSSQPTEEKRSSGSRSSRSGSSRPAPRDQQPRKEEGADMPDLNEQATVVNDFLVGLLDAFGLEGAVETSVKDEDIIVANVTGEQAEALIGPKGAILQAILELTRTVVQRKTQAGARLRLDIGGYSERRREALKIYAARLAEQVVEEGEEVMLEPMNPADRKAVHDVIGEIDGVRSYSEGEEPRRSVVISPAPTD